MNYSSRKQQTFINAFKMFRIFAESETIHFIIEKLTKELLKGKAHIFISTELEEQRWLDFYHYYSDF